MRNEYAGIGSRETPEDVLKDITSIARMMHRQGYHLRSGAADGADAAFERGADGNATIFLPWKGFNQHTTGVVVKGEFAYRARNITKKFHPAYDRLSDAGIKLMTRNVYQVLGATLDSPARMVICWTSDGKASGGTGQAMRIASAYDIPIFNLRLGRKTVLKLREFIGE